MSSQSPESRGAPMTDALEPQRRIPVTVLMQCTPLPEHPWLDEKRQILAVIPRAEDHERTAPAQINTRLMPKPVVETESDAGPSRIVRYDEFEITLYIDEADSYYLNISTETPRCFVVLDEDEDTQKMEPLLVTASADLAASYESVDHPIEVVPMDPAIYPDVEAFVLTHHIPEKFVKRKRKNWSEPS